MNVENCRRMLQKALSPQYGEREAKAITSLIFLYVKGWNTTQCIINSDTELSDFALNQIESILKRLEAGEPIQYITGTARFHGMDLHVAPGVLIPRPETEQLVDIITDRHDARDLKILDIGTGSGAIAVALARTLPFARVSAIDISDDALTIARRNASDKGADITFIKCDVALWSPQPASFNIIVSNPPYIEPVEALDMERHVLDHEPAIALFAPAEDPIYFYRIIADKALVALSHPGYLYFEINPRQVLNMVEMLRAKGFTNIDTIKDFNGRDRFVCATLI